MTLRGNVSTLYVFLMSLQQDTTTRGTKTLSFQQGIRGQKSMALALTMVGSEAFSYSTKERREDWK
jgi:hypothetical protein